MARSFEKDPRPVKIGALGTSQISLPPKQESEVVADCTMKRDGELIALFPHMHQLGTGMKFEVENDAGEFEVAYERTPYDFDQQFIDIFERTIPADRKTRVTCSYKNTHDKLITYGESSREEMCFLITFTLDRSASCSGEGDLEEVPRDPAAGECGEHTPNDEGVGLHCTTGGGECPLGLMCTADQSQAGGAEDGFCMKVACGSYADCGGGQVACCAPSQGGGMINICLPEACRPTDCVPLP
jgi:hypothetical protein